MGIDLSPGASVALGIFVGLVSTCVQSIGLTQQRKSHLLEEQKQEEDGNHVQRPAYRRRRWQVGMLMFLVSNIVGSSIQITTLPLPVLSTLQASGLVFNTICATLVLGEPFTRYSLIGTLLVAIGAALIGIFGSVTEPSHSLQQLLAFLGRWNFLVWLCGTFLIVILLVTGTFLIRSLHPRQTHRVRLIRGMSFGAVSGILSAHTLLLAKSAVELLIRTIVDHVNQFNQWQSWMILLGLIVLALTQLYYLNRGLKLCSTSVLYPFVFCVYNVVAILDGLIYFDQGPRLPARDAALIFVGTVVLLGGVVSLSWRLQADDDLPGPTAVDVKAKSRVITPRTILQPGLGIEPEDPNAAEYLEEDMEEAPFIRPTDDEEALADSSHLHHHKLGEHTPLLRTKTGPMRPQAGSLKPLRPPKIRRMTTIQDDATVDLWDELNDRPGSRRYTFDSQSQRSPVTPRSTGGHGKRSVSGPRKSRTLSLSNRRSSLKDYASVPWRYLRHSSASLQNYGSMGITGGGGGEGSSRKRISSRDFGTSPPPMSDPSDAEEGEDERLLGAEMDGPGEGSSGMGAETKPNWVKLQKWWKKRWRSEEDEGGV